MAEKLVATDKEAQLVALFVGMFVDQGVGKERMIRLLTPDNLARVYDVVKEKQV